MVAMMLVVNYAEKDKNGTSSAQTVSLARLDLAAAQRSAAAQQTAGGAARVDLCVPVRCSASARAATAMALPAVAPRHAAAHRTRLRARHPPHFRSESSPQRSEAAAARERRHACRVAATCACMAHGWPLTGAVDLCARHSGCSRVCGRMAVAAAPV